MKEPAAYKFSIQEDTTYKGPTLIATGYRCVFQHRGETPGQAGAQAASEELQC